VSKARRAKKVRRLVVALERVSVAAATAAGSMAELSGSLETLRGTMEQQWTIRRVEDFFRGLSDSLGEW